MATNMQNRRIVLANRPKDSASVDNFRMETVPAGEPAEGEEGPEDSLEAFFSGTRGVIAAAVDAALGGEAGAEVEVEGEAPGQGPAVGHVGEAAAET